MEVDTKTTNGTPQNLAVAHATPLPEDLGAASEDRHSGGPTSTPQANLGPPSSPQTPASLENQVACAGQMSASPVQGLEDNGSCDFLEKTVAPASDTLEDRPRVAVQDRTEEPQRATGERASGAPASSAGAALSPGTHPEVAHREGPLGGLPGALAMPPSSQNTEAEGQMVNSSRSGPRRLECDFSNTDTSKRPSPPRDLGRRADPQPLPRQEARQEKAPEEEGEGPVPPSQGSYDPDWDQLDDPNFNVSGGDGETQPQEHPQSRPVGPMAELLSAGRAAAGDSFPSQ